MKCTSMRKHVEAYVDGELEPSRSIDVEQHLGDCGDCRTQVGMQRHFKLQVGVALRDVSAPEQLRQRVATGLDQASGGRQFHGTTVFLTAAAAVVLLGVSWTQRPGQKDPAAKPGSAKEASLVGGAMPVFRDIVQKHSNPLPAEIQVERPEQIVPWFRGKVGFQVHPVAFKEQRVRLLGARIDHVSDLSAATLYYDVNGHRVTAVVFEPTPDMYEGTQRMNVGGRDVYMSNVRGYAVPMIRHGNIAYAFTGDLDQRNLLRMVASAQLQ